MSAPADTVWARAEKLAYVSSPGRVALLPLANLSATALVLEDTAAAIWEHVDGQRSLEQILDLLAGDFDVSAGDIHDHVVDLLTELERRDAVVRIRG